MIIHLISPSLTSSITSFHFSLIRANISALALIDLALPTKHRHHERKKEDHAAKRRAAVNPADAMKTAMDRAGIPGGATPASSSSGGGAANPAAEAAALSHGHGG